MYNTPSSTVPIPADHNTINPFVIVSDANGFIRFVEAVFGGKEAEHVRTLDRDGKIIHAEVVVGGSTIMLSDSKDDWPFSPAFLQIYVSDAETCLNTAAQLGAQVVTPLCDFYGGYRLARILDPWKNLWWLYEPDTQPVSQNQRDSDTEWHDRKPSLVYTTLMDTMGSLGRPESRERDHES